jgi:hypothetical protein
MIWDMVRQVSSRLAMTRHVRISNVRVLHAMVWNVGEIHFWAEISGQGTRGQ